MSDLHSSVRSKPKAPATTRFNIFHKLIPLGVVLAGVSAATQYFAERCAYSPRLGAPLVGHFYNPLYFVVWAYKFANYDPVTPYFDYCYFLLFIFSVAGIALYFVMAYARGKADKAENLYGTADWATKNDLLNNGLLQPDGVALAQLHDANVKYDGSEGSLRYEVKRASDVICHGGEVSTLLVAPARSGKGIGPIFCTLTSWRGSVFVNDPKGELYAQTAGFRRQFSHVLKFSPVSKDSARFNFLAEVRPGEPAFRDANLIADELVQCTHLKSDKGSDNSEHFDQKARDLLTGVILFVLLNPDWQDKSLGGVLNFLSTAGLDDDIDGEDLSQAIVDAMRGANYPQDEQYIGTIRNIRASANRYIAMVDRERQSVYSTAVKALAVFEDPIVHLNTSEHDFSISDFVTSEYPLSIYMTFPYSDMDRLAPIMRLLVNYTLRRLTEGETGFGAITLKNRLLVLLDEFPTFKANKYIEEAAGVIPGFGITFFLICQSLEQLISVYGEHQPFLEHCKVWATFAPGDYKSAELFSKIIGKESVLKASTSFSGSKFDAGLANLNSSTSEVERNLINPDEIMRLKPNEVLVFAHGMKPYLGKKLVWYADERFINRGNMPVPLKREEILSEVPKHGSAVFDWHSISSPIPEEEPVDDLYQHLPCVGGEEAMAPAASPEAGLLDNNAVKVENDGKD